ncbi:MAG TPA: phosphomannomutase/phosphoglucomutase [Verrucomicrobiae bacterium]|nr:phosphomannomutase/phosphoglucomutase [Verrucomicrobiae bacterium]
MSPSIFKAYDIRGLSPGELDAAFAGRLGKCLAKQFSPKRVVVGHDMRLTSEELEQALVDGLTSQGVHVIRIGLCSTPMFNFAIAEADGTYDLGVMVTASHNPSKYNGFKITRGDCLPVGEGAGMEELRDLALSDTLLPDANVRGGVGDDPEVLERYVDAVWMRARLAGEFEGLTLCIDAGNGMDGVVLPKLTRKLRDANVRELYWMPDGRFPNHEANPIKRETLEDLTEDVKKSGALFGVAFDGDGDRVGFVDEKGEPIPGDIMTALLAQEVLREKGSGIVLYDVRSSWSTRDAILAAGGEPRMCKVGHANIKRQMAAERAVFAGELSMHFYFNEFKNCESGDYAMLLVLKRVLREQKPLSEIWKPVAKYYKSDELNFDAAHAKTKIEELAAAYEPSSRHVSRLDGVRIEFDDWWFNVRASNTEPLVRLNVEANSRALLDEKVAELSALIKA